MPRIEKNAAGEDVDVSSPAFGCKTVEHAKPATKSKTKPGTAPADEGDE